MELHDRLMVGVRTERLARIRRGMVVRRQEAEERQAP
jgi:hypothetical protein